jgi:hypothetical protein
LTVGRDAIINYFKIVVGTGSKVQFVEQHLKLWYWRLVSMIFCATRTAR